MNRSRDSTDPKQPREIAPTSTVFQWLESFSRLSAIVLTNSKPTNRHSSCDMMGFIDSK
ncbi:hypothetical protein PHMEG_00019736 [Phytophthora megakarya]|uniref:Uncharacterized protein n=1 Tax=Phytophthora megakarya TaxID=4795 RepID=A0A225VQW0_9STRA|nr:hypothetical protein PHMEG_00019736 [Phytophthora megakarya]